MTGNGWDLADEVAYRKNIADLDERIHTIPLPRFTPKGCADGSHWMRRDPAGLRCWVCTGCGERRPFNVDGDQ